MENYRKECSILKVKNKPTNKYIKFAGYGASIALWVIIWHIASVYVDSDIFLPSPLTVLTVLWQDLLPSEEFRRSLVSSLMHIGTGFLIGAIIGILLAIASSTNNVIKTFFWFPIKVIKSVPVASFVILVLLWLDAGSLAIFIPAMIVLPTLYINTLTGITQTNEKLLEMADLFNVTFTKRVIYIYIPHTIPHVLSACSLAIGMAWKAGVAAEIIGLAKDSIGNELYKAKLYIMTPELFAWTLVIVILSIACEGIIKLTIKAFERDTHE